MPAFMNEASPNRNDRHQGRLAYGDANFLPKEVANVVWEEAQEASLALRLGTQVAVGQGETLINVNTVKPEVGQVGVGSTPATREGYRKPLSGIAWETQAFSAIKLASIVTASSEFARSNPAGLWSSLQGEMAQAVGRGIDLAVFHGADAMTGTGLLGITNNGYIDQTTNRQVYDAGTPIPLDVAIATAWADGVNYGVDPDAIAVDPLLIPLLILARDASGNPLFQNSFNLSQNAVASIGGLPLERGKAVSGRIGRHPDSGTRAYVGDFAGRLLYGYADAVRFSISDQATIYSADGTPIPLWQTNQVAVLIETTFGWKVDAEAFSAIDTDSPLGGSVGLVPVGESAADAVTTDIGAES